jgi:hypothetical protein
LLAEERRRVDERPFDAAAFYARVGAAPREQSALRQDLIRGLKDYFAHIYGYDRYGAETVFLVPERLGHPHAFGFALLRILHDRRISESVKTAAASYALGSIAYGQDGGLPYGLLAAVHFLAQRDLLSTGEFRYALVVSAGEVDPFAGVDKPAMLDFFGRLLSRSAFSADERAFWAHSLIGRHQDQPGAAELINLLMGADGIPTTLRAELCWAWIHFRQPRLEVPVPSPDGTARSRFISEHLPFWVAHVPSWPTLSMVRLGLVWLPRLGEDPLALAETYIEYRNAFAEQMHAAVAEIIAEHHTEMPEASVRRVIERGITITGSGPTRRRFYRLGADLYGASYLTRASEDAAGSVRQWAARQLQRQA